MSFAAEIEEGTYAAECAARRMPWLTRVPSMRTSLKRGTSFKAAAYDAAAAEIP